MDRKDFDPDGVGVDNGNYFGFPFTEEDARLVLLSVPWDVTASYGGGAAFGPDAIIEASTQLDFYDPMSPGAWKKGVATVPIDYSVQDRSARLRPDAKKIMESLQEGGIAFEDYLMPRRLERINTASAELNRTVYEAAAERLDAGHVVGLVGGDQYTAGAHQGACRTGTGHGCAPSGCALRPAQGIRGVRLFACFHHV